MKTIVIYHSKTGFTQTYAEWLAEALQCEIIPYAERGKIKCTDYDAIIYGGWLCAGKIRGAGWFKKAVCPLPGVKKAVFAVGLTPAEAPQAAEYLRQNFPGDQYGDVRLFYMPGGLCYEKLDAVSRMVLRMLCNRLRNKKNKTPEEDGMLAMLSSSSDGSSRKYTEPLVAYIRSSEE